MYIVLSSGHGNTDPGCCNAAYDLKEHLEAYHIVWELRDSLRAAGHTVDWVSCFQSLSGKIAAVNDLHDNVPVDLAIEIHFNSVVDATAHGTEVCYVSDQTVRVAAAISAAIAQMLGIRDRGAKYRDDLGWLNQTVPPAVLVETLFLSNPAEAGLVCDTDFPSRVAEAITAALVT